MTARKVPIKRWVLTYRYSHQTHPDIKFLPIVDNQAGFHFAPPLLVLLLQQSELVNVLTIKKPILLQLP